MYLSLTVSFLVSLAVETVLGAAFPATSKRETVEEAALRARELISYRSDGIGTLMTVFPDGYQEDETLSGQSVGLQEYFAPAPSSLTTNPNNADTFDSVRDSFPPSFEPADNSGDLILLAMPISRVFHNALYPSPDSKDSLNNRRNATITIKDERSERDKGKMWAAGRARVVLWGYLEVLGVEENDIAKKAKDVYVTEHPDSKLWTPPGGPHEAFFVLFRATKLFFFGGFGNVAYIDYIPLDLYRKSQPRDEKLAMKEWDEMEEKMWTQGVLNDNGRMMIQGV